MQKVEVQLGSEIIYVTGSVNGVEKTFALAENGVWQTFAERAANNTYEVEILAYDGAGNSQSFQETVNFGFAVVTDRTQRDVDYAKELGKKIQEKGFEKLTASEQTLWLDGLKGCYNVADLNRVETAVAYLATLFEGLGYHGEVNLKTDWQMTDIPFASLLAEYLQNVKNLREIYCVMPNTPKLPETMANLDFKGANAIEENLRDMNLLLEFMVAQFQHCGTFFCEEN